MRQIRKLTLYLINHKTQVLETPCVLSKEIVQLFRGANNV